MDSHRGTGDSYRLIVTRRKASEILLLPNGSGWGLPQVEIRPQRRVAEQLASEVSRGWGLETYCLFVSSPRTSSGNGEAKCAVMESVKHNDKAPAGTYWMAPCVTTGWGDGREAEAIRESLEELDSYASGERFGPFAKPGWLGDLFIWTQEQVAPLGLRLAGGFRQLNASPTFSLIRLETDAGALWFKATGEPNTHELPVSLSLARLFPRHVPRMLGIHPAWNGWLTAEVSGTELDQTAECALWERAAEQLAELQIESIGRGSELLEAKCKDLRIRRLVEQIDPYLARMAEFMAAQEKASPAPLSTSELSSLTQGLRESCSLLQSVGLPDTLGHIDFNPGNILVSQDRCVFVDWAEACVTNPLFTLEYLRQHLGRSALQETPAVERVTAAYLRPWMSFHSLDDLRRALTFSPLVAIFVYAVSSDSWRSPDAIHKPTLAGYFRSLTRRMYREAMSAAERSELCLD